MTVPRGVNDQTACMSATEAASTTDSAPIDGFDPTGAGAREEVTRRYIRSPEDVLRLVGFAVTSLVLIGITIWLEDAVVGVEEDIIELFGFLSPSIERVLHGGIEIVSGLVIVMVYLIPLVVRRYRLFGYILLSSAVAGLVMQGVRWLIDRETSTSVLNELAQRAGITSSVPSGAIAISQTAAMFIVVAPFVTRRWRRAGAITITILLLLRLLVSVRLPAEAFVALYAGDNIKIADICHAADVSERTLQYAFVERFGIGPKEYLNAFRLFSARRRLRAADPRTMNVADVANECGFWHLGQFAADYRERFEELPSQTLRSGSSG